MTKTITEQIFDTDRKTKKAVSEEKNKKAKKIDKLTKELQSKGIDGAEISKQVYSLNLKETAKIDSMKETYKKLKKEKSIVREELIRTGTINKVLINEVPADIIADIKLPIRITNHEQYVEWISKKNLQALFPLIAEWEISKGEDKKYYDCPFFKGNIAWISVDDNGIYRFFSKKPQAHSIGLSWLDIIEIAEGKGVGTSYGFITARRKLSDILNHNYKEKEVENMQINKYSENIDIIERAYVDMKQDFPILYNFIKNYLHILEHMNAWGKAHMTSKDAMIKGESVFFVSTTHMEHFVKRDQTVISKAINCFCTLGLISKVKYTDAPETIRTMANELICYKPQFNMINFYIIPAYSVDVLMEAQERVKKLKANGITNATQITKDKLVDTFNKPFAKRIYDISATTVAQQIDQSLESYLLFESLN